LKEEQRRSTPFSSGFGDFRVGPQVAIEISERNTCVTSVSVSNRSASEVRPHAATPPDKDGVLLRRRFDAGGGLRSTRGLNPRRTEEHTHTQGEARNREEEQRVRTARILAIATALVSLAIVVALGAIGVWLTAEARMFGLVMLAAGSVAALLVMYFEWRHELHRRYISEEVEVTRAA
jgi:hypothetical protein